MPRGGPRPGSGRKKFSHNKLHEEAARKAAAEGFLPHEFLLSIARGDVIDGHVPTFTERVDAAKACSPYYAPRLTTSDVTMRRVSSFDDLSDAELAALAGSASVETKAKRKAESGSLH